MIASSWTSYRLAIIVGDSPVGRLERKTCLKYSRAHLQVDTHIEGWVSKILILDPREVGQYRSVQSDTDNERERYSPVLIEHCSPEPIGTSFRCLFSQGQIIPS